MSETKTFVFPAYASSYAMVGEHHVECVVPDYLAGLTAGEILDVLERHAEWVKGAGAEFTPVGARLIRATGRAANGQYPSVSDVSPASRDAALGDALRDLHGDPASRFAPRYVRDGRAVSRPEFVAYLRSR